MSIRAVASPKLPPVKGPYSPAIEAGDFVFCAGMLPTDPATGQLVEGSMADLARRALDNIGLVLEAAGLTMAHVVKSTVFLADLNDFAEMNQEYATYFAAPAPARTTVQVAALPLGARVEIEVVAYRG